MTTNPTAHHRYLADDDEHETYASVGLDGLLSATEKLLAVNRGLAEPDERDSLPNDRIHTPDRLMAERVKLDHGRTLRTLMGRLSRSKSLTPMGADVFAPYTVGYLAGNPLAPALEEINPMHILEQKRRVTKMGPGGVGDPSAITLSMQSVHASQFGFVDPISGPECMPGDSEVYTKRGWVRWDAVKDDDVFACNVSGRFEWHRASRVVRELYSGPMIVGSSSNIHMMVTPSHRVVFKRDPEAFELSVTFASDLSGADIYIPTSPTLDLLDKSYETSGLRLESQRLLPECWSSESFNGMVYCATVPGGMLYVRGKSNHPGFWTGNSDKAGIDVRLAHGTRIGSDGRVYQVMLNRKTGKKQWVSPSDLVGKTLKLPD
jgi:hypothetical protein